MKSPWIDDYHLFTMPHHFLFYCAPPLFFTVPHHFLGTTQKVMGHSKKNWRSTPKLYCAPPLYIPCRRPWVWHFISSNCEKILKSDPGELLIGATESIINVTFGLWILTALYDSCGDHIFKAYQRLFNPCGYWYRSEWDLWEKRRPVSVKKSPSAILVYCI